MPVNIEFARMYLQKFWPSLWRSDIPWDDESVCRFWELASNVWETRTGEPGHSYTPRNQTNTGNIVVYGDVSYTKTPDPFGLIELTFGTKPAALFYDERKEDGSLLRRHLWVFR